MTSTEVKKEEGGHAREIAKSILEKVVGRFGGASAPVTSFPGFARIMKKIPSKTPQLLRRDK